MLVKIGSTGSSKRFSPVLNNIIKDPLKIINIKTSATYIKLKLKNKEIGAIVDSGAESTIINKNLAEKLKLKIANHRSDVKYIAANGQSLNMVGYCFLDLCISGKKIKQMAVVIDNLSTQLLLGTDMLSNYGMIINYSNKTLTIGEYSTKIFTNKPIFETQRHFLITKENISVPPRCVHVEWIDIPESFKGTVYLEDLRKRNSLEIKEGIFNVEGMKVPLIFTNTNKFVVKIGKRKKIALLESIGSFETISSITRSMGVDTGTSQLEKKVRAIDLVKWENVNCTKDELAELKRLVDKYDHIFSKNSNDLGYYERNKFEINTNNEKPIKMRPYRVPYAQQETVNKLIDDMLLNKIISKSKSPWASPLVIVKKKDGSDRFCVDYRKLNGITVKDNYPVPLIEETLDSLQGSTYFSTLDLASGYWQMALAEDSKEKTAFISQRGLFQFEVLPFGLSNAVASFQRTMESILEGLNNSKVYLDDIMTHSKTFNSHLLQLEEVFKRLDEANLKVKPSKCLFVSRTTKFLGFDISEKGIRPCEDKLKAMITYPVPKNQKAIKRFLGMASYYRKFIPKYSSIAEPISKLLKKNAKFIWDDKCSKNFRKIIYLLTHPPILTFPDFSRQFILQTDASNVGLGAVLAQIDEKGDEKAIGYASRMLKGAERNYHTTELECLAIVWGIEQFKPYLYGRHFLIYSDHNPLVYMDNTKNKSSRINRWRLNLAEFDYKVIYKKGILNANADALSRIESEVAREVNSVNSVVFNDNVFKLSQENDIFVQEIKKKLDLGVKTSFFLENGLLYKSVVRGNSCLVIPLSMVDTVLKMCHNDMGGGHLGFRKTWPKIRNRFYWKTMYWKTM